MVPIDDRIRGPLTASKQVDNSKRILVEYTIESFPNQNHSENSIAGQLHKDEEVQENKHKV